MNVSTFITGSNSKLLSGELATLLTGRFISIKNDAIHIFRIYRIKKIKKSRNK